MFGVVEEEEAESLDGGATNVVIHVGNGNVEKTLDRLVVTSA